MNLIFHKILPVPRDSHGELLEKIFTNDEGKYDKDQSVKVTVAKMEKFIERKKYICMLISTKFLVKLMIFLATQTIHQKKILKSHGLIPEKLMTLTMVLMKCLSLHLNKKV